MSEAGKPDASYILTFGSHGLMESGLVREATDWGVVFPVMFDSHPGVCSADNDHFTHELQTPGQLASSGQHRADHGPTPAWYSMTRQSGIQDCKPMNRDDSLGFWLGISRFAEKASFSFKESFHYSEQPTPGWQLSSLHA